MPGKQIFCSIFAPGANNENVQVLMYNLNILDAFAYLANSSFELEPEPFIIKCLYSKHSVKLDILENAQTSPTFY